MNGTLWRLVLAALFLLRSTSGGTPFRFAIVGDRTGRAVRGVYEAVWQEVAKSHPDLVITVGDAIEGFDGERASREWNFVSKNWPRNVPVYHTPGNHDIWDAASASLFTRVTGDKPFYSFDFGGAHFVVLDNSRTENLSDEQLRFLDEDLKTRKSSGPQFLFFHRAFWLLPLKLGVKDFALQNIVKSRGICCVISGHGHQFQTLLQDGVRYVEIGSSGASLAPAGPPGSDFADGWFYQYAYVTVDGMSVTFEVRELPPPFGQGRVIRFQADRR